MAIDHVADAALKLLRQEIQRSEDSRYDHRLHCVLLVAQAMSCQEAAQRLGDSPRTVQHWVRSFERHGLTGLQEGQRPGRPRRLSDEQAELVRSVVRKQPDQAGLPAKRWDGKTLSAYLLRRHGIPLGVRQCQRILGSLRSSAA